jgi:tripeptide aminopeptidase
MQTHQNGHASPIEVFMDLVRLPAPSGHERETADFCKNMLQNMGASVTEDDSGFKSGGNAGNIIAVFEGADARVPPIMLNAHMDTVEPGGPIIPVISGTRIISKTDTILGADNRAGLVMILMGLTELLATHKKAPCRMEVVLTVGEENGLLGAGSLDYRQIESTYGFSLDSSGLGRIGTGAPYYNAITITAKGRSSHAAVNPDVGINSILILSSILKKLPFGRIDPETTANVGTITGGSARNVVPDRCTAELELRSHSLTTLEALTDVIRNISVNSAEKWNVHLDGRTIKPEIDVQIHREFDGFLLEPECPVVACAADALTAIDRPVTLSRNMGGSDANVFNANHIQTAVIGTGQTAVHSHDEYIEIKDLIDGVNLVKQLVETWTKWWSQKKA